MIKEIPILFSTAMVQALLEGRKTQTRRIVDPQPIWSVDKDGNLYEGKHKGYVKVDGHPDWSQQFAHQFAKWKKRDVLWVRETFTVLKPEHCIDMDKRFAYKASCCAESNEIRKEYIECGWPYPGSRRSICLKKLHVSGYR